MKRLFLLVICIVSFNVFAESPVNELNHSLKNISSMQANFTQTITAESGRLVQRSKGMMVLSRPGKFRWQVNSPIAQLIIANDKKLWIYDKDLEQVTIRSLAKSTGGETPGLLLSDADPHFETDFKVKKLDSEWYLLEAKDKSSMFASIQMRFQNNAITEMQLEDHMGQVTKVLFTRISVNKSLPASLFALQFPKNTDVIDETKS